MDRYSWQRGGVSLGLWLTNMANKDVLVNAITRMPMGQEDCWTNNMMIYTILPIRQYYRNHR